MTPTLIPQQQRVLKVFKIRKKKEIENQGPTRVLVRQFCTIRTRTKISQITKVERQGASRSLAPALSQLGTTTTRNTSCAPRIQRQAMPSRQQIHCPSQAGFVKTKKSRRLRPKGNRPATLAGKMAWKKEKVHQPTCTRKKEKNHTHSGQNAYSQLGQLAENNVTDGQGSIKLKFGMCILERASLTKQCLQCCTFLDAVLNCPLNGEMHELGSS